MKSVLSLQHTEVVEKVVIDRQTRKLVNASALSGLRKEATMTSEGEFPWP